LFAISVFSFKLSTINTLFCYNFYNLLFILFDYPFGVGVGVGVGVLVGVGVGVGVLVGVGVGVTKAVISSTQSSPHISKL
jgi:hypothetical protein